MTKEELRKELERQAQRYQDIYGGEVTTYAAAVAPERKPWRRKPSVQDQVFREELRKLEQQRSADDSEDGGPA
ncbi:hypothetical protein [Pseudomonas oligotrophica]|uniref:hypothetical protein n=1 Tax=Pseudomonas oligotrophica TaxID=2912055 RepID=UPI001F3A61B7|nr:hypothetical protein [Pseudomonas oligotrophica]